MDLLREGLFLASVAFAYQEITKQKVLKDTNIKYATIGGVLGLLVGPKIEEYVRADKSLSPEIKNKILGAGVGAIGGYAVGDKLVDQTKKKVATLEKTVEAYDK